MSDLPKRLRIKASMIQLGERIAWGSDVEIMEEAADEIERINESLRVELSALRQQEAEIHELREERDNLAIQLSIANAHLGRLHTEAVMKSEMEARAANPFHGMYQDAAGTIPVTAVGQPVGRMEIDGEALVQSFAANRPKSMSGGFIAETITEWLEPEK